MRRREAKMGGKYSAECWEKIAGINREISSRQDPSSLIDELIQATASARPSPPRKSETSGHRFNGFETPLSAVARQPDTSV